MTAAVLVTRPAPGAAETAARLRALGHEPLIASMLVVETLNFTLAAGARFQAVLVTSANAARRLPPELCDVAVYAVGAATARAARAAGFLRTVSADGDSARLAALVARKCRPDGPALLVAHGQGQGDGLCATLHAAGFGLCRAPVYAVRRLSALPEPAASAWRAGAIGRALFFSAETAQAFAAAALAEDQGAGARGVGAIAISAAAAAALAPLPFASVRVAVRPDQESMLSLLT